MSGSPLLYAEIQNDIKGLIKSGAWPPGYRIPSEHELMEQYGCSRMTVHRAISALAAAGLVVRKRRSGSFVATPRTEETVLEIHDIKAEIAATGRAYRCELIQRRIRPATAEDAERLQVKVGHEVLAIEARHLADKQPFVLERRLINLEAVPDARNEAFDDGPSGSWLLRRVPWSDAEHSIRAISARADIAAQLGVSRGAACLLVERRTWHSNMPVTYVRLFYPGDRHQLVGRFRPAIPPGRSRGS